jgi:Anti-sigma-28 factor, FlgM
MSGTEHSAAEPADRVRRLREAIEHGTYAPNVENVAESLLGWLVAADRFDEQPSQAEPVDTAREDQGPLPRAPGASHTADSP